MTTHEDPARLFWVVESPEANEEIFATQEEAEAYAKQMFTKEEPYTIYIGEVRNYFWEPDLQGWNYDDLADTFNKIITITVQSDTRKLS